VVDSPALGVGTAETVAIPEQEIHRMLSDNGLEEAADRLHRRLKGKVSLGPNRSILREALGERVVPAVATVGKSS
jgi:hypothetical protein